MVTAVDTDTTRSGEPQVAGQAGGPWPDRQGLHALGQSEETDLRHREDL
jgi:hypothetical protein